MERTGKREERQAGAGNANRRPRAQPVIYTALCICVRTDRPPPCANILTHDVNVRLSTADSEMFRRGGQGSGLSYVVPAPRLAGDTSVAQDLRLSVCLCALWQRDGYIGKMWEAFLCYWRVEEWMGGFHPGLSLIREGSLIPSHPMV